MAVRRALYRASDCLILAQILPSMCDSDSNPKFVNLGSQQFNAVQQAAELDDCKLVPEPTAHRLQKQQSSSPQPPPSQHPSSQPPSPSQQPFPPLIAVHAAASPTPAPAPATVLLRKDSLYYTNDDQHPITATTFETILAWRRFGRKRTYAGG